MAQPKPEDKVTVEQVLKLVDQLTPEEQSQLRQAFLKTKKIFALL
jgi:hypothetical protein